MSGSWCMWCLMTQNQWNKEEGVPLEHQEEWTIDKLKAHKILVEEGTLKKPTEIRGVVDFPLWDFIEVKYYVYPVLHGEIGLVNNALDAFSDILDDNIEVMSDEEKTARNTTIFADATLESAVEKLKDWKERSSIDVRFYEVLNSEIKDRLKGQGISQDERNELVAKRAEINKNIADMKAQPKLLEEDVKNKNELFSAAKKS